MRAVVSYDIGAAVEPSTTKQELPALAIQDRFRELKEKLTQQLPVMSRHHDAGLDPELR